jgi:hypothetical protein
MRDVLVLEQSVKCQQQIAIDIKKLLTQGRSAPVPESRTIAR